MTTVYLVNIGANSKHRNKARSPIFANSSYVYVPFPEDDGDSERGARTYPRECLPFVRTQSSATGHIDPDWENLTYGDNVRRGRGGNLRNVISGDILLFWGMLWANNGCNWDGFTNDRRWYLLGAIRVDVVVHGDTKLNELTAEHRERARHNAHFHREIVPSDHRVFVGTRRYSNRFKKAVSLGFDEPNGLAYRTCTTQAGELLSPNGRPHWRSSLRSSRALWNLTVPTERRRANIVRRAIEQLNDFDIFENVPA